MFTLLYCYITTALYSLGYFPNTNWYTINIKQQLILNINQNYFSNQVYKQNVPPGRNKRPASVNSYSIHRQECAKCSGVKIDLAGINCTQFNRVKRGRKKVSCVTSRTSPSFGKCQHLQSNWIAIRNDRPLALMHWSSFGIGIHIRFAGDIIVIAYRLGNLTECAVVYIEQCRGSFQ